MSRPTTDKPTTAQLRAVCQPASTMNRRNGEHWAGRLYIRRVSIHVTKVFLALGWTPNSVTCLMIAVGLSAGVLLQIPGVVGALLAVVAIQLYLLLDSCDGEVARWTKRTSVTGVYLDRVGHYVCEAGLLVGAGFRAADGSPDGYAVLGCLAALGAVLVKAETDLVQAARYSAGLPQVGDEALAPRSRSLGLARRAASVLGVHRITGATEASLLLLVAAIIDAAGRDLTATRFLVALFAVVALTMVVLHLASVLASRRLQ